jgi:hypothetical protein
MLHNVGAKNKKIKHRLLCVEIKNNSFWPRPQTVLLKDAAVVHRFNPINNLRQEPVVNPNTGRPQRSSAKFAMRSISKFNKLDAKVHEEMLSLNLRDYKPEASSDEEIAREVSKESCRYCKLYIGERDDKEAHIREIHPEKVTCTECNEVLQNEMVLKKHIKQHADDKRPIRVVKRIKVLIVIIKCQIIEIHRNKV